MIQADNVSKERLEKALVEIRKDTVRLSGLLGIVSGDSDFWLVCATCIGLTHLIQVNFQLDLGRAIFFSAVIVYCVYVLKMWRAKRLVNELTREQSMPGTEVDL